MSTENSPASRALEGYRIADFTQVLAGPFATQQLAQLGAEVVKVELPGSGDMTRGGLITGSGKESASFITCNIGKQSITIDLKHEAARPVLKRLIERSDAVVQNFKPGVMDRLGLGYDQVKDWRPDIVYCSISGYGQEGPLSKLPAFDGAIQASSGMVSTTGHPGEMPVRAGYFAVDMSTALNAAFAITGALLRRERSGAGQHIDVSMLDTAMMMLAPQMSGYLIAGALPEPLGNRSPTKQATANVFPTADGLIQIVALRDHQAAALYECLGQPELAQRFPSAADRVQNFEALNAAISAVTRTATTAEWSAKLLAADVPVSEVRSLDQVAREPQFEHRLSLAEVTAHSDTDETLRVVSASHTANVDAPEVQRPAPRLGEHNELVLSELGFSADEIHQIRASGALGDVS